MHIAAGETGFAGAIYDLIAVQDHALKAGHDYDQYVRDAENANFLPNGRWCPQPAGTSAPGPARPDRISPRARLPRRGPCPPWPRSAPLSAPGDGGVRMPTGRRGLLPRGDLGAQLGHPLGVQGGAQPRCSSVAMVWLSSCQLCSNLARPSRSSCSVTSSKSTPAVAS